MKVRFYLKDKRGLIIMKYTFLRRGLPFVFSTRQYCKPAEWDPKKQRARATMNTPHLSDLNSILDRIESETLSLHRQLLLKGVRPQKEHFKKHLSKVLLFSQQQKMNLLNFYQDEFIPKYMKSTSADSTKLAYSDNSSLLQKLHTEGLPVDFYKINENYLQLYQQKCIERGMSPTTIKQALIKIKKVLREAAERGYMDPIEFRKPEPVKATRNTVILTREEIERIARTSYMHLPYAETLRRVADVIVVGCSTGLRFSDLSKLKRHNFKEFNGLKILEVRTKKTGVKVAVPVFDFALEVLEKYDFNLPDLTYRVLMKRGKEVLNEAEVDDLVELYSSKGGKLSVKLVPKWQAFSTHMMRRTFASLSYLDNPALLPHIQKVLGHKSQQQTLDYINVDRLLNAEELSKRI